MTIEQMKMILYVAESASVNQAARRLFISQPALSKAIQAAERELGQPLFERSKTGMEPTEYGSVFCNTARSIVDSYERVKHLAVESAHLEYLSLRVSSCPMKFAGMAFAELFSKYAINASELRFVAKSSAACVNDLVEGASDIGLINIITPMRDEVLVELDKAELRYTTLREFDPAIVISRDSILSHPNGGVIRCEDLAEMTLFSIYQELSVFERMDREILRLMGLNPTRYVTYYDPRAGLHNIIRPNEFRCTLDSKDIYQALGECNQLFEGVRTLRLASPPFRIEVGTIQRIDAPRNALVDEYIDRLRAFTGAN